MPDPELEALLAQARELSWAHHGRRLSLHLPGMFVAYGRRGRYPAVSLTGAQCDLACDHCAGRLLETMLPAQTPAELVDLGRRLWAKGQLGLLLSGGSDRQGRLPWPRFLEAIAELKASTGLILTAHVGRIDDAIARALKQAGVSQALVDVVGDEQTARQVLHLADGLAAQEETLTACAQAGLEVVPHLIMGLLSGRLAGEQAALERLIELNSRVLVFVVLMPLKGTPLAGVEPPPVEDVAAFLARARLLHPRARHHLGCARPRGRYRARLDRLAVLAGVNALALPSDAARETAAQLGLEVQEHPFCCSLASGPWMGGS